MYQALTDGFLSAISKQASKADIFLHTIGKKRNIHFVTGSKSQDFLVDRVLEQPKLRKNILRHAKETSIPVKVIEDNARNYLRQTEEVAGTILKGNAYIDKASTLRSLTSARDTVNHEAFHLKPIIGKSESLAHLYGGLKSQKGRLSPTGAIKGYRHLWRTRPNVARKELMPVLAATGGVGGYYGWQLLKKKKDGDAL